jgi:hypothetical protein
MEQKNGKKNDCRSEQDYGGNRIEPGGEPGSG